MKYLFILAISTSTLAIPPDANINDVVLNELLFNPHSITPSTGQNCDGDGNLDEDGQGNGNAADEFIEFYNNGVTDVDLEGYCLSADPAVAGSTVTNSKRRWLVPAGVIVPAGGFLHICGDNGSGLGFSIPPVLNGDEVEQFSNSSGVGGNGKTPSLYEPSVAGDCSSTITTVVFSHGYDGGAENNGEPYLRCFTDGTSPLDYYRNGNGDFAVPTPGAANCTVSTPVYVNHIKHTGSVLEWQAGLEFNHIGYNVYSIKSDKSQEKINSQIISRKNNLNYRLDLQEKYHNQKLLLTAVDIYGNEQKLDYIEVDQQFGEKDKATIIDWQKSNVDKLHYSEKIHNPKSAKILVNQSGIQKIRVQSLLDNGFDITGFNKRNILLTDNGEPVPFLIKPQNKKIRATDNIIFIANKANSKYSDTHIYSLSKSRNSKHIKTIKAEPKSNIEFNKFFMETIIIEENNSYEFTSPNNDPWIMKSLLAFDQSRSDTWIVDLPFLSKDRDAQSEFITTAASINGVTDFPGAENDHHVELLVNNQSESQYFDGQEFVELINTQRSKYLSSPYEITLVQPADTGFEYDLVNLDKFTITYPRTFDAEMGKLDFVSNSKNFSVKGFESKDVIILSESEDNTFLLEGAIKSEENANFVIDFYNSINNSHIYISQWDDINQPEISVTDKPEIEPLDYLIVTKKEFIPHLIDYKNLKQAQGLKTMVVDSESIFAHYGSISNNPNSLKAYIDKINRLRPLSYVMIVGSDQYDYKNYLESEAQSIVPTFYRNTGNGINHAPTDVPFVDFNNDNTADIPIGRLTVNNVDELNNILQKIQTFQNSIHENELFVTDNIDSENFVSIAEHLSSLSTTNIQLINTFELGVEQANMDLIRALNEGTDFVNWIGHSSANRWSRDNVFDIKDVNLLQNPPSVFFQLGCWNSYFVDPINQTLANSLLQKKDYGAVATIGSSTYTKTDGEKLLTQYYKEFINNNNQVTIGQAFNYALNKYATDNPERKDILLGYQLLGDPTMLIK